MMGPSHFCSSISSESFGVDCFVRNFSFYAQSFISFSLAFCAASSHIRSPQITRSIRIASTLQFGLICFYSFSIPV